MVLFPLYLLVMNWVLLFEVSLCWIEYWIWEHLTYVLHMDTHGDNGILIHLMYILVLNSWIPEVTLGNLCIGLMHVFVLHSPIETLEWFFVACWGIVLWSNYVIIVERLCTSESTNPRPCFQALQYRFCSLLLLVTLLFLYFQITKTYIYHPYYTCITISSPN